MSIPTITANPTRDLGSAAFYAQIELAWQQLPATIDGINTALSTIESAEDTVTAALNAPLWVSGTTYVVGDLRISPANGFIYRRKTAGAGTTDPSADGTNWSLRTVMGYPLVVVSGTTHTVAERTFCLITNPAATTLTLPAVPPADFEFGLRVGNDRVDNILDGNGNRVETALDTVYLDSPALNGIWRYFTSSIGYGRA